MMAVTADPGSLTPVPGDGEFISLLLNHRAALLRYAFRLSSSVADAEDLLQDTSLKCWRARSHFEAGTNFHGWARTVIRNTYFTAVRRRRYEGDVEGHAIERLTSAQPSQHTALELTDALSALKKLDEGPRRAVIMASEGVSIEDGAAALQIGTNTYKSWVSRGRKRLEKLVEGGEQPDPIRSSGVRSFTPLASRQRLLPRKRCWAGVMIG